MAITPRRIDFKLFAAARNANVLTNESYFASPYVGPGVKTGKASAPLYNKTMRQLSLIAVSLATYLSQRLNEDVIDDGTIETLVDQIKRAIGKQAQTDVVIPEGTLKQKGIVQFSNVVNSGSPSEDDDSKAATIGILSKIHRRLEVIESYVNNTFKPTASQKYNPVYDWMIPIGTMLVYNNDTNPNLLYPGTTWEKLAAGVGIRTAKNDKSDLAKLGGADSVSLKTNQLPTFKLAVNINTTEFDYGSKVSNPTNLGSPSTSGHDYGTITSSGFDYGTKNTESHNIGNVETSEFDYGTKGTNGAGGHNHTITVARGGDGGDGSDGGVPYACMWNSSNTSWAPDHTHTVTIGAHKHTVVIGAHLHSVYIGAHSHTTVIGAHTHTVSLGSHTHVTPIGAHSHLVSGYTSEIGSGYPIDIINTYYGSNIWIRTA